MFDQAKFVGIPKEKDESDSFLREHNFKIKFLTKNAEENGSLLFGDIKEEKEQNDNQDLDESTATPLPDESPIQDHENGKTCINKHLIPLRAALVFWYGAGRLPGSFLSVFMKQRGMSLVEFSSVFSATFIFQLLSAAVSGIIADKIGNAKPVLMFHMIATVSVIVCMLLAPNISQDSCIRQDFKFSSSYIANISFQNLTKCRLLSLETNSSYNVSLESGDAVDFHNRNSILSSSELLNISQFDTDENVSFSSVSNTSFASLCNDSNSNCTISCLINEIDCQLADRTFVIIYVSLMLAFFTFWSTAYRFMDVTAMTLVKEFGSTYGFERVFAMTSEMVMAVSTALAMNFIDTSALSRNKYDIVYWMCAGLMMLSIVSVYIIRIKIKPPGQRLMKKAFTLVKNAEIMAFYIVLLVAGSSFCFFINFNLWYLDYLEAPKILFGLHSASFSFYGIVVLLLSKQLLKRIEIRKIFMLGLLAYTINGIAYSFLHEPFLALLFESCMGFSYHLFWVAVVQHCHDIAPEGLFATVTAVSGAIHYAIGRSIGVLGGGILMSVLGPRTTYRIFAAVCLSTAIAYAVFTYRRQTPSRKKQNSNSLHN